MCDVLVRFRSENENEDECEFCPPEVWYFVFVLVFVLVICYFRLKTACVLYPDFLLVSRKKNQYYDRNNDVLWMSHLAKKTS